MRRLASTLRIAAFAAAAAAAYLILGTFIAFKPLLHVRVGGLLSDLDTAEIDSLPIWLRAMVLSVPSLVFAGAMYRLAQLLQLAARSEVFSAPAATHLRSCGILLFIKTIADSVLPPLAHALNLWLTHAEHGKLTWSINSGEIWNIFISALFMLVARILADAYRIAEENRQII